MDYFVHVNGTELRVDGQLVDAELAPVSESPVRAARIGGRSLRLVPRRNGRGDWTLDIEGTTYRAQVLDARQEAAFSARQSSGSARGPSPLKAPMPGLVVRVEVAPGDVVEPGVGVVIVEAMKMENELTAEARARVTQIRVEAGSTVDKDDILVEFEAVEEEE